MKVSVIGVPLMQEMDSIFNDEWPENHRSGVVAVVGRPNVGKSTLINAILGHKVAIATARPQTTRRNQLGIFTTDEAQILFVDTPGLHRAQSRLGEYMVESAERALKDADVILWILDASEPPSGADTHIAGRISELRGNTPVVLVLNKIDQLKSGADVSAHLELIEHIAVHRISALKDEGVSELVEALGAMLPEGPRYYPAEQLSDQNMRFVAAEIVREKIILNTEQEIPHAVAVVVDSYKEEEDRATINATIYVERDSQKGIIIGKGGQMIKTIGTQARQELIALLGTAVHLELHVKVLKNWRSDERLMRRVGYFIPKDED